MKILPLYVNEIQQLQRKITQYRLDREDDPHYQNTISRVRLARLIDIIQMNITWSNWGDCKTVERILENNWSEERLRNTLETFKTIDATSVKLMEEWGWIKPNEQ